MKSKIRCLVVSKASDRYATLENVLGALPLKILRAGSCREADLLLCESTPPHLVFTEVVLDDGNWLDVLDFSRKPKQKVNVVVISPQANVRLYIDVMSHGAFDFVTESFTVPELVHILRTAIDNACEARGESLVIPPAIRWRGQVPVNFRPADSESAV